MKILYFTAQRQNLSYHEIADYMSDMTFHGFRELFGVDCIDCPVKDHLYKDYQDTDKLWGHGFSYANTLDNIEIDRTDIDSKLALGYFDYVIYSIHHSMQMEYILNENNLHLLNQRISPTKTIVIDGHDWTKFNPNYFSYSQFIFKRENDESDGRLLPISFSIPESKIIKQVPIKTKDFAFIHPGSCESHWPQDSRKTHIYTKEEDYYNDYQQSRFAFTCKKGGWDCMRHYEILANGCIPIFTDIENCPRLTLTTLDKSALSHIKNTRQIHLAKTNNNICYGGHEIIPNESYLTDKFNPGLYDVFANLFLEHATKYITTKYTAKKILEYLYV